MIGQQINLYQDRFRPKRLWISAGQTVLLLLISAVVMASWGGFILVKLDKVNSEARRVNADKEQLAGELKLLNAELAKLLEDKSLDLQISSLASEITARKSILNFADFNQFGSGAGFSAYLVALSNLQEEDIWLNEIIIGPSFVGIKGSSLNAEKVPAYFDRFSDEAIFKGKRFDVFELNRDADSLWKVDFVISTKGGNDG
ncbi:MAG: hypothetical protein ACI9LO_000718 [Planctomycetota bacterium]|jgi:hypothetical protein